MKHQRSATLLTKAKTIYANNQHDISNAKEDAKADEVTVIVENEKIGDTKTVVQVEGTK